MDSTATRSVFHPDQSCGARQKQKRAGQFVAACCSSLERDGCVQQTADTWLGDVVQGWRLRLEPLGAVMHSCCPLAAVCVIITGPLLQGGVTTATGGGGDGGQTNWKIWDGCV